MQHAILTCTMPSSHAPCHPHMHHAILTCTMPSSHAPCHPHMHHAILTCTMPSSHAPCHPHMHHAILTCTMPSLHAPCHPHMHKVVVEYMREITECGLMYLLKKWLSYILDKCSKNVYCTIFLINHISFIKERISFKLGTHFL